MILGLEGVARHAHGGSHAWRDFMAKCTHLHEWHPGVDLVGEGRRHDCSVDMFKNGWLARGLADGMKDAKTEPIAKERRGRVTAHPVGDESIGTTLEFALPRERLRVKGAARADANIERVVTRVDLLVRDDPGARRPVEILKHHVDAADDLWPMVPESDIPQVTVDVTHGQGAGLEPQLMLPTT